MGDSVILEDAALSGEAQEQLRSLGTFDIVVGIPSHRNGRTIGEVVQSVSEGIGAFYADYRVLLVNADGGSSDNTMRHVIDAALPGNVSRLVTEYVGPMGKGRAIRALLEATHLADARACLVLEARCPGITPDWVPALLSPVLAGHDIAVARYDRSAAAAALTDNLAYPFVRLFYNSNLREPIPGEFSLSGTLAAHLVSRDVWETDVSRFGFGIWLTMQALADERRLVQVDVGYRGDGHLEPGVLTDLRFLHMAGTLFRYLSLYAQVWKQDLVPRLIPLAGTTASGGVYPCAECVAPMLAGFRDGRATMYGLWEQVLSRRTLAEVAALADEPADRFAFPAELWARAVVESAVVYNRGDGDPDKVVEALLPIYYGRAAAYLRQAERKTGVEREPLVDETVRAFLQHRRTLLGLWYDHVPSSTFEDDWAAR